MDPNSISLVGSFINQYGFPMVVAGALFWYIVVETRANRKVIEELKGVLAQHTEMVKQFSDAIKELTRHG